MAKPTHDIVATMGQFKDRDGNVKKRFQNVGKAFTDDQGRISLKLEAIPAGPDWSGWLSLYPVRDDQGGGQRQEAPARRPAPTAPVRQPDDDDGEQVPF